MVKKKEKLLAFGMICLIIAFSLDILQDSNIIIDWISLILIGLSIFANADYLVSTDSTTNKKSKK
jgi:hypothetical protein